MFFEIQFTWISIALSLGIKNEWEYTALTFRYSDETHRLWTDKLPVQGQKETVRIKICSLVHQTLVLKTVKLEDDNKTLEILSMTVAENNPKLSLSEKVWQGEKCEKQLQDILFTTPLHARQPNWNIWGWNSSFQ